MFFIFFFGCWCFCFVVYVFLYGRWGVSFCWVVLWWCWMVGFFVVVIFDFCVWVVV